MTDATTLSTSFADTGFCVGDMIRMTVGRTSSDYMKKRCRRRFWYKPWTWFNRNYAICKIAKVGSHALDLEGD